MRPPSVFAKATCMTAVYIRAISIKEDIQFRCNIGMALQHTKITYFKYQLLGEFWLLSLAILYWAYLEAVHCNALRCKSWEAMHLKKAVRT